MTDLLWALIPQTEYLCSAGGKFDDKLYFLLELEERFVD
jgi:hypothetical protein